MRLKGKHKRIKVELVKISLIFQAGLILCRFYTNFMRKSIPFCIILTTRKV